jgi:hypothetical protein
MTFTTRLNIALALLARTGIRRIVYAPHTHRVLWRLGVKVRPPHFSRQAANIFLVWLVVFPAIVLIRLALANDTLAGHLAEGAQLGFFVALFAATWFRKVAEDYGLPDWSEVESPDQPFRSSSPSHWLRDE